MEIRESAGLAARKRTNPTLPIYHFLFSIIFVAGCGVPSDPLPPSPPIPVPVGDLTVHQLGDGVQLSFTPPKKSTRGERLTESATVEVLRGRPKPDGAPDVKSFQMVDTVPGPLLGKYLQQGKVEFLDPVSPEEARAHPGETLFYRVRTRVSERNASADSNDASVKLYPVPERIVALQTHETENNIELKWEAPQRTSSGEPLSAIQEYHVYRGELDPASAAAATKDLRDAVWKLPLLQLVTANSPEYQDGGFDYGKTYAYIVRSAVRAEGALLESGDSAPAIVTPKDVFPPAAPQDLVAAVLPGATPGATLVDLSWSINVETDLAGYRVYRSEQEGARGQLLTPDLLPTPQYRDASAQAGRRCWYTVTAVDRAGNESAPSASALAEIP